MEISGVGTKTLKVLAEGKERGRETVGMQREERESPSHNCPLKSVVSHFSKWCLYLVRGASRPVAAADR